MKKLLVLLAVATLSLTSFAGTITIFSKTMIKSTIYSSDYNKRTAETINATYKLNQNARAEFYLMDEGYYGAYAIAQVQWDGNLVQGSAFVYTRTGTIVGKANGTYINLYMQAKPSTGKVGYAKSKIIGYLYYGSGSWL